MNKLKLGLIAILLLIGVNTANAQSTFIPDGFSWTKVFSATPTQIGLAYWKNASNVASTGAASCIDPFANYTPAGSALHLGLGEICGLVGGGVSADSNGKFSLPITLGLSFKMGPLSLHGGAGPDLVGTPVSMVSGTYPF